MAHLIWCCRTTLLVLLLLLLLSWRWRIVALSLIAASPPSCLLSSLLLYPSTPAVSPSSSSSAPPPPPRLPHVLLPTRCCPPLLETCCPYVSSKAFPTKQHLDDHRRTHTGEKPYVCTWPGCPQAFALESNLTAHLLAQVHTGHKPYKCTAGIAKCTKAYTSKRELLDHVAACHNGEPRWQCLHAECGEWFNSSTARSVHVRQAHQGKTWACPVVECDVQSHSPAARAYHVLSVHQYGTPQYDAYMARHRGYDANRRQRQRLARVPRAVAEVMVRRKVEQDSGVQRDVQPLTAEEPLGIIDEYAESACHVFRLTSALPDTATDDHLTRRGV